MENKTYSNQEKGARALPFWDALGLALQENHSPDLRKFLTNSFNRLYVEAEERSSDLLKFLTHLFNSLNAETQVSALRALGEIAAQLPEGSRRGVISYFLAKHLEDTREELRVTATIAVGVLIRQTLVEAVALRLVSDKSARVRMASAEALGESTTSVILRTLKESLRDESWEVRAAAVQTLGKLGEQLIIEPLRTALDDQDFSVRSAAIHALGTLKGCVSTEYFVSLARDETNDWCTREAAVTALERIGEHILARPLREKLDCELESEMDQSEEETEFGPIEKETNDTESHYIPDEPEKRCRLLPGLVKRKKIEGKNALSPHKLKSEERAACVLHCLKEYGEAIFFPAQRIIKAFSPVRSSTSHLLKHCGEEILSQSSSSKKRVVYVSHRLKKHGERLFSRFREIIAALRLLPSLNGKNLFSHVRGIVVALPLLLVVGGVLLGVGDALLASHASNVSPGVPSVAPSPIGVLNIAPHPPDNALLKIMSQLGPVSPGQQFWISITATNNGPITWTDTGGYQLTCKTDDHQAVDCLRVSMVIGSPVPRGDTCTFKVLFVAPPIPGTYTLLLTMSHNSIPFGDPLRIKVRVS